MSSNTKKHSRKAVKEYALKTICYLLIMLAVTVAVAFGTIHMVTNFVHMIEERVPMEVRDITLDDSAYKPQNGESGGVTEYGNYGAKIGVITSDGFGLNSSVYCGANRISMSEGVGYDAQSGLIGGNGTSVIIGYMEGAFSPLEYAELDDVIYLTVEGSAYSYRITDIQYSESTYDTFRSSSSALVLCGICSDFSQHSGENLVVFADRTDGEVQ